MSIPARLCSIPIFRFSLENAEECNKIYEIISIRVEDPTLNMFINQDSFLFFVVVSESRVESHQH